MFLQKCSAKVRLFPEIAMLLLKNFRRKGAKKKFCGLCCIIRKMFSRKQWTL